MECYGVKVFLSDVAVYYLSTGSGCNAGLP